MHGLYILLQQFRNAFGVLLPVRKHLPEKTMVHPVINI